MILRRNGNKTKIAPNIQAYFPDHKTYIEPFFGAGGMFFNKPRAKHNFLNDLDDDVFNLFMVIKDHRSLLYKAIEEMPIHQSLMKYWKKAEEKDPVWKAVRFLFLSNFTYLSKGYNVRFTADNSKEILLSRIEPTFERMSNAKFMNCDFRDVLKNISFQCEHGLNKKEDSFIYSDPPYFETNGWYKHKFNSNDVIDHFGVLVNSGIRFATSEFDSGFILEIAKQYGLNVIDICERRNLKNRRKEVLITNYESKVITESKQSSLIFMD